MVLRSLTGGIVVAAPAQTVLKRDLGVVGATMLGLGSILGTGVFVSLGLVAGVAGPATLLAVVLAAGIATCNAMSSAQLAANYPRSGGTYEYGYELLTPAAGFSAGWMFLSAKSASAATAALGCAAYLGLALGLPEALRTTVAAGLVVVLTVLAARGIRRSSQVNMVIVGVTLVALVGFVVGGLPRALAAGAENSTPFFPPHGGFTALLQATALMFVAYTGYGRVATLGEEVHDPRKTIPRAILSTLVISALLYLGVASVGILGAGADAMSAATEARGAPLAVLARGMDLPWIAHLLAVGAVTAMLGVLLNLILGLSRVLFAMGRRGDMPQSTARVHTGRGTPAVAVWVMGAVILALTLVGSIKLAWSFSAFTVLIYYALTNLAALRLRPEQRLYPRWVSWVGLVSCLGVAFFVEPRIWLVGLAWLVVGWAWRVGLRMLRPAH